MRMLLCVLYGVCALSGHIDAGQTHPCDQVPPAEVTIASGAPHKSQFCSLQSDGVEAVLAILNAGTSGELNFVLVPIAVKTPTPNANGYILLETAPFLQVPRGQHTLTLKAYNTNKLTGLTQLGDPSLPFPFGADEDTPRAAAPKVMGIVR